MTALLDALDAAEAENERLRGDATDLERLADTYTTEGTVIVLNKILDLRAELAEARATLAALREAVEGAGVSRLCESAAGLNSPDSVAYSLAQIVYRVRALAAAPSETEEGR